VLGAVISKPGCFPAQATDFNLIDCLCKDNLGSCPGAAIPVGTHYFRGQNNFFSSLEQINIYYSL